MENAIIVAILLVLMVVALLRVKKHFKGGCCGGGSVVRVRKELSAPKLGEKRLIIEGMHCENCQARIENAINRMDGVACRVNLRKKTAVVAYSEPVSDELLKDSVEKLGYKVKEIC